MEWYPWGPEALEVAKRLERPLLISIGYASCHWCHVMAHESFDDEAVAAVMNEHFVSIKVDREERPDLDAIYMAATQAQTGHGGWPMTVFATPDGRPFYCGTYFPPTDRYGTPGFTRVLNAMATAWHDARDEVEARAQEFTTAVQREAGFADELALRPHAGLPAPRDVLTQAVAELAERFDPTYGGFSPAPKFPRPALIELALLAAHTGIDAGARTLATTTLDAMARGGIYDHLLGGFARYSTDEQWLVPHFEKMATDQALLVRSYLHAFQLTKNPEYAQVVRETLDWVLDELRGEHGALFASVDADAEGIEGAFATFTPTTVRTALEAAGLGHLTERTTLRYHLDGVPTFEGAYVPYLDLGAPLGRDEDLEAARAALAAARRRRVQPAVDTKVLLEWNAMVAAALAEAGAVLGEPRYVAAAAGVVETCLEVLTRGDGRLLRSYADGRTSELATASDYAWLAEACARLYEATGGHAWLGQACEVADALLVGFWDGEVTAGVINPADPGGLFTTGHDAEALLARPKEVFDGAVPAAGSTAASMFSRLGRLADRPRYTAVAERLFARSAPLLEGHPTAIGDLTLAYLCHALGAEVVIPGTTPELVEVVHQRYLPGTVLVTGDPTPTSLFEGRTAGHAYLCQGQTCQLATADPSTLGAQLDQLAAL